VAKDDTVAHLRAELSLGFELDADTPVERRELSGRRSEWAEGLRGFLTEMLGSRHGNWFMDAGEPPPRSTNLAQTLLFGTPAERRSQAFYRQRLANLRAIIEQLEKS